MKNLIRIMLVAVVAILLWRCSEQQPENAVTREVKFTIRTTASPGTDGRLASDDIPAGTELVLSVQNSNGEYVLNHQHVELLKLGDSFVSSPVTLSEGTYNVVDFMLVKDAEVLYATPQAGSPFAELVANPLPYEFTVTADALLAVDAEVVSADSTQPEDFGYVSFNINALSAGNIVISAFAADDEGIRLTAATAFILDGPDTVAEKSLEPGNNDFPFVLGSASTYKLVVVSDGYDRYERIFQYNDLKEELNGQPLNITLHPAFTFVIAATANAINVLNVAGGYGSPTGVVTINWGDGQLQGAIIDAIPSDPSHYFDQDGTYFGSVTGDIGLIRHADLLALGQAVVNLDLRHLHALEGYNASNAGHGAGTLRSIRVSRKGQMANLNISNTLLSGAALSKVIDDLYAGALHSNIQNGVFDYTHVSTPSAQALQQFVTLSQDYGWTIIPAPL